MTLQIDYKNQYINMLPPLDHPSDGKSLYPSLICFSHLRWDFVYQRPQHVISRFANTYKVYFWEEPVFLEGNTPSLDIRVLKKNLVILIPQLPFGLKATEIDQIQKNLLDSFIEQSNLNLEVIWYYTPMSFCWSSHLTTKILIYDCMDELSAFNFAPIEIKEYERLLMKKSDLIFTGGKSLYEAKKLLHEAVYSFPSSVDVGHFIRARDKFIIEPEDQQNIPHPRLGFYGVIDERLDISLLKGIAETKPDWQLVIIGPVVKIDPQSLPKLPNIHYLGKKDYSMLPNYLKGWDVALLPFALNESTRFISPTKTPEYLAAGKVVVSTPITDVVNEYKDCEVVRFAHPDCKDNFIKEIEEAIKDAKELSSIYERVDSILKNMSWDKTYEAMYELILAHFDKKQVI